MPGYQPLQNQRTILPKNIKPTVTVRHYYMNFDDKATYSDIKQYILKTQMIDMVNNQSEICVFTTPFSSKDQTAAPLSIVLITTPNRALQ